MCRQTITDYFLRDQIEHLVAHENTALLTVLFLTLLKQNQKIDEKKAENLW